MAKTNKNYLSKQDIDIIQNKIINIFGDEASEKIILNTNELINELDYIIQKVELVKSGHRIKRSSTEKRRLMAEAYLIIFKIREFLLNEEIDYRYYYNTDNTAKVIHFKEKNILDYIKFGSEGLKIADTILKKQEINQTYQTLINQHYNNLIAGVQPASNSNLQVVHSYIMRKYESFNPGLRKQTGKGAGSYQVFTRGHLFEAMDIAFSEVIAQNKIEDYNLIEYYMYGKYLNYDSVAGTKGGDNAITMTQIKANAADLLDYSTLLKDLKILKNIFNKDKIKIDKDKIRKNIKDLYLHESKYEDINDFNNAIDDALEKVVISLTS